MHNGSSLFTGDAGQGESNIRRWIIENDWLEAIVALPLNMFYNTGIATYIWVLTNRKPAHRRGKVQLIDATRLVPAAAQEPGQEELRAVARRTSSASATTFLAFEETRAVQDLPQRGLRLLEGDGRAAAAPARGPVGAEQRAAFRQACAEAEEEAAGRSDRPRGRARWAPGRTTTSTPFLDAAGRTRPAARASSSPPSARSCCRAELAERDEDAAPVVKKVHKPGKGDGRRRCRRTAARPYVVEAASRRVVEYEPDTDLRDTEQVPLLEEGGIEAFIRREVLPHVPDAWIDEDGAKIGYEICFTRYFYKPQPLRTLEEIRADILALEQETEGLARRDHRSDWREIGESCRGQPARLPEKVRAVRIPIYQRTYSWTERECRQLWDDILRTGKDDEILGPFCRVDRLHPREPLPCLYAVVIAGHRWPAAAVTVMPHH